jgi:hypothetical protein
VLGDEHRGQVRTRNAVRPRELVEHAAGQAGIDLAPDSPRYLTVALMRVTI